MYSRAKIAGHPIHTMLVAFPIVFYTTTLLAFMLYQFGGQDVFWYKLAFFCNFAGIITAALAAIPGTIDWYFGIPKNTAAHRRGLTHMLFNVGALVLFCVNAFRLYGNWNFPPESAGSYVLYSLIAVAMTMAAGWHGWELIATHKVGVNLTPEQERLEPVEKMDVPKSRIDTRKPQGVL